MPRWQRIYLAACAGVIGYAVAYVLSDFASLPRLTYFPRRHAWHLIERTTDPAPMAYYGMLLWGGGGALVAAALVALATTRARRPLPRRWLQLAGGWAITAVALAAAYFAWNLWPF